MENESHIPLGQTIILIAPFAQNGKKMMFERSKEWKVGGGASVRPWIIYSILQKRDKENREQVNGDYFLCSSSFSKLQR